MTLLGALDQGTTSTRFIVFDDGGREVARHQLEHRQLLARPGWVEHDPKELWTNSAAVIDGALDRAGLAGSDLAAIGIANQRETVVVWDRRSGEPLMDAIVWQDTRTADQVAELRGRGVEELVRRRTGLPLATYFSATKLRWALDHVEGLRELAVRGDAAAGTVDSWLLWKLTGGRSHATDVTNASRTQLFDLDSLSWDDELLELFGIPPAMLPAIYGSTLPAGELLTDPDGPLGAAVPIGAVLGDQQAAMFGQCCFQPGDAKCTYGTGSFLLVNTGAEVVRSAHGLLSTVCYQLDGEAAHFALEGSVAVTGSAVQWLRDQLGIITTAAESETLARQVDDAEGVVFVPAFSGLFAPYWRSDARGTIVGLTRSHTSAHLARATLEAICYQCRDLVDVIADDLGQGLPALKVDGGVAANDLCMQLQADVLGVPVVRPLGLETTALGAAYAAGLAVGVFDDLASLRARWREERRFLPTWDGERRDRAIRRWHRAIERSLGWAEPGETGLCQTEPGETGLCQTEPGETGLCQTEPGETGLCQTEPGGPA